jgi:hypothetical protein
MKAMLDPRMVPASIQPLDAAHGTAPPADRMTASSHGIRIEIMDATKKPFDCKADGKVKPDSSCALYAGR